MVLREADTSTDNWLNALASLDVPTCGDPNDGSCAGSYFIPSSIDPHNQTRSDARLAYHDKAAHRSNYHLITSTRVSRVIFDDKRDAYREIQNATGVEVSRVCPRRSRWLTSFSAAQFVRQLDFLHCCQERGDTRSRSHPHPTAARAFGDRETRFVVFAWDFRSEGSARCGK
jgi:hypothetical protein